MSTHARKKKINLESVTLRGSAFSQKGKYWNYLSRAFFRVFLYLEIGLNGKQKRASCSATLLLYELKSDVARFTTENQTCLATNQIAASCEKLLRFFADLN